MNWKKVSEHLLGDANYYNLKADRASCPSERDAHMATANTLRSLGTALLAGLQPVDEPAYTFRGMVCGYDWQLITKVRPTTDDLAKIKHQISVMFDAFV